MSIIDTVTELLENAPDGSLSRVLCEQDHAGLWNTTQGSFKSSDSQSFVWDGLVTNIGLHTFIVERLLQDWSNLRTARLAAIKGLNAILADAVEAEGKLMWRWLKIPTRQDYLYAPDYDDSARAVSVLHIGEHLLTSTEVVQLELVRNGRTPGLDLANSAARDLCTLDQNLLLSQGQDGAFRAVSTFVGGLSSKANNTADPVVNVNILYALSSTKLISSTAAFRSLANEIVNYLSEVVKRQDRIFPRFSEFSHYYLSPCLFAYLCAQVRSVAPRIISEDMMQRLVKGIMDFSSQRKLTAEEAAWILVLLREANVFNVPLARRLAARILLSFDHKLGVINPSPIYQHKRLGHLFGSGAFSTLICLEGLRSFITLTSTTSDSLSSSRSQPVRHHSQNAI